MASKTESLEAKPLGNALGDWLAKLFGIYGKPSTPDIVAGYAVALEDLSEDSLKLAFEETFRSHRTSFAPTPGEIRGYLEAALDKLPRAGPAARPDCPQCWGTGFTIVQLKDSTYAVAVSCKCLQRPGAPS